MKNMECLENIIGVSKTICECFGVIDVKYNTSKSGLFLDNLDGINSSVILAGEDCGKGNAWERAYNAISSATEDVRADLLTELEGKLKQVSPYFNDMIGGIKYNGTVTVTGSIIGLKIKPKQYKGAEIIIKKITTAFNASGTIELNVYDNYSTTPIRTVTLNTSANLINHNDIDDIVLPSRVEGKPNLTYYLIYNYSEALKPLNCELGCGCSGGNLWDAWLKAEGVQLSDLNRIINGDVATRGYTHGILPHIKTNCSKSIVICDEEMDFVNDASALNIARCVQFKAGIKLMDQALTKPDTSIFTLNAEALSYYIKQYSERYLQLISFIAANTNPSNGCFVCNSKMKVSTITR